MWEVEDSQCPDPHFKVRQRQDLWEVTIFGVIYILLGLEMLCPFPASIASHWALGPSQQKGNFRVILGSGYDRWKHGLENHLWQRAMPVSAQEVSCSIPQKQFPFHANACLESLGTPTREKPISFQHPADGTSHQKAFHSFQHVIYCFVPFVEEGMVLPNIFNFQSQTNCYIKASCHQ